MDIGEPQVSMNLVLQNVYWIDESNMDDIDLGKKNAEVVILNDIGMAVDSLVYVGFCKFADMYLS